MRAHSTIDRQCYSDFDTGPCPTWMKTLEEKYKRLHMKIVFNANANRRRTRILSAASIRTRNPRALNTRENLRPTSTIGPQSAHITQKSTNTEELELKQAFDSKDEVPEVSAEKPEVNEDGTECNLIRGDLSDISAENSSLLDSNPEMKNSILKKVGGAKKNVSIQSDSPHSEQLSGNKINRPPAPQRQEPLLMREPTREELQKRSKLFQRMSKEAQTAILEARSEKKKQMLLNGRRESLLLNNFTNQARNSQTDVYGVTLPLDSSKRSRPKSCAAVYSPSTSSSDDSNVGDVKADEHEEIRRLPEIVSARTESTFKSVEKQKNVLLPGVGNYKIALLREQTFQVTGAEYDIRYREVIQTGRRDSVTPPSDILEQAMMKCQEWLSKYVVCSTPRK